MTREQAIQDILSELDRLPKAGGMYVLETDVLRDALDIAITAGRLMKTEERLEELEQREKQTA